MPTPDGRTHSRRRLSPWGGVWLLACGLLGASASAARAQGEPLRPPVLVIEDLLAGDFKTAKGARLELTRLGARAVPAILEARQRQGLPRERRESLDQALREIVDVLVKTLNEGVEVRPSPGPAEGALGGLSGSIDPDPIGDLDLSADELGDLGSVSGELPTEAYPKWVRAQRARAALRLLGPAITQPMLRLPPVREAPLARLLLQTAEEIFARERAAAAAAGDEAQREAFKARYRGLADLASPIVAAGVSDAEAPVRALFQAVRDESLGATLSALESPSADARELAEEALFRLGGLATIHLQAVAAGRDPELQSVQAKAAAERIARRIRFGLTRELILRLGQDLEGYEQLSFRERRALVFEIERVGGAEAIPCLRALLQVEESVEVKLAAASGLLRQRDPAGLAWLRAQGADLPQLGLSKSELAAIHVDQGLRHLTHARFPRAAREFEQAIENEPGNEIAWYNLACTYSRWEKVDLALKALKRAIENGFDDTKHMASDTDLDNIRRTPGYRALINKILESRGEPLLDDAPDEPEPPGERPR